MNESKPLPLKEVVELLHKIGYPEATERRIKQYAKDKYIIPKRFNPQNPKSKYRYTDQNIQDLRFLFSLMLVFPLIEKAGPLINVFRSNYDYWSFLADDESFAELNSTPINLEQEPWRTLNDRYIRFHSENIRYEKEQVLEKIQEAFARITQAQMIISTVLSDLNKVASIANKSDRLELVRKFETEKFKSKSNKTHRS